MTIHAPIDFSSQCFSSVIDLPETYEIYDFSLGYDPERALQSEYGIGRYNEKRPGMYTTALFTADPLQARDIHVGIDIAAPVGTPVRAFFDGVVYLAGINSAPGDYGGTLITEHVVEGRRIWALHGHLSHESVKGKTPGQKITSGEVIAWLGNKEENGGWNFHLHFQLCLEKPDRCDMPGAVNHQDLERALRLYPDPRCVLGPLY